MNLVCQNEGHLQSPIILFCLNQYCRASKLLCVKCIQQDLHTGHNQDLVQYSTMIEFVNKQSLECDQFIKYIQTNIDQSQEILSKIKFGLRQKYELNAERLKRWNNQQLSQALIEITQFGNKKEQIELELVEGILNLNKLLENIYTQIQLDNLTYRDISEKDKNKAKELYNEGYKLYWNDKKYKEAIEKFNSSLDINPYDCEILLFKGISLKLIFEYDEALISLNKALDIDPKNVQSLYNEGDCLRLKGQYDEALIWVNQALEIDPKHVLSLWNKGDCLRMKSQYDEALIWVNKALDVDPNKGECLRRLGKIDEALIWINKALTINPQHVLSLSSKGCCLQQKQQYKDALLFLDQALNINSNDNQALVAKAKSLEALRKYEDALVYFEKALVQYPTWGSLIEGKEFCQKQLGIKQ